MSATTTPPDESPLDNLKAKSYGSEYHMTPVRLVVARVQADKPVLKDGRFVSKFGKDLTAGYLNGLDSLNAASVEGALMYVQANVINQNARTELERCMRVENMSYVVLFDVLVAQTNETIAQFEDKWTVPEYGPMIPMDSGSCTPRTPGGDTFPPECLQLNGDQGQPNLGPFVGARLRDDDIRAPYPNTYWFSFPHTCPLKTWSEKSDLCRASTRKGLCDLGQAPDGVTCTYAYDILGWVPLDDLVGITSIKDSNGMRYKRFTTWCQASEKNVEFAADAATGKLVQGLDFWKDPLNATRNSERADKLIRLYENIVAGDVVSDLISKSELEYFKALPTVKSLAAKNPACFKSVRTCNSGNGCARSGFSQICTPCKAGETCPTNSSYSLPTLTKAKTALSDSELTSGSSFGLTSGSSIGLTSGSSLGGVTDDSTNGTVVTPAPPSSPSKSGLSTALIVSGVVVLIVGIAAVFLRRRGYSCFGRRAGGKAEKPQVPSPAIGETNAGTDGVYVDMESQEKLTTAVSAEAFVGHSQMSESNAKQPNVEKEDEFPGQLLLAVRISFEELQLGNTISQGGFGEVLLATYKNQDVAVKRLLTHRQCDPKSVASFAQEILLNATLDHECLVRFIGAAWDVRENLCMVSEYVRGGDLRTLLSEYVAKGYPNGLDGGKLRTAIQIAQALTYLHSLNPPVVHRDLKSRNVLLTEVLDAKLIDFGVSTECLDETMTAGVGTSLWMAPEIMMGKRYDVKADVFSFGVILSELDTHEIPYDHVRDPGSNRKLASALLNRLIYEGRVKPRFTEKADPEIVVLARDCLEVDPSKRPTSAQVLDRIRQFGRQGGRSSSQMDTQSTPSDTHNSLRFETQATTQSGRPI